MPTSAALVSTFVVAQAVLAAAPLAVRLTSDVAECPSSVQVQSALRQVLGDGERSAGGWVLWYGRDPSAPAAERDSSVLMELVDPAGQRLAVRRIPASPGDCDAIASAMAAVVERSLRSLGWTRGEPLPESARQTNATESSTPAARKRLPRMVLGAGPSIASSPRMGTNLLLEVRVRVAGPFCLRLGGGVFAGSDSQNVGSGKASVTSHYFTAAPLAAFALGSEVMTSKKRKIINWPVPLRKRDNSLGEAVREYAQSTEETRGEAPVYARVLARVGRRSRRVPMLAAGLAMAGVLATVALVVLHRDTAVSTGIVASRSTLPVSAPSPRLASAETSLPAARPSQTPPVPTPPIASIRLGRLPASPPAGKVDVVGQATAVLSDDAVASGRAQTGNTEIVLSKGSIEFRVIPRAPGHDFAVSAGRYRFTVMGTAFTISQTRSRLELVVSEGTVAVWRGTRRLATVGAGAEWAVDLKPGASSDVRPQTARTQDVQSAAVARMEPLPPVAPTLTPPLAAPAAVAATFSARATPTLAPPPATPTAVTAAPPARAATPAAAAHRDCGQLAAGKHVREAVSCYQDQAVQSGLAGETAQYEVARLWRDSLAEPGRALAAFQTQRSRFPNGVLRTEADLSIIELLPRLGHHADALAESERFLTAHPKAERSGEIHLLRGNIYREVLRDLDHAEREYARGAEAGGRVGDDSRFLHAVCLEALGRVDEARKVYEAYLLKPGATHAQEAKKRLEGLRP